MKRLIVVFVLFFLAINPLLFATENCLLTGVIHNLKAPQMRIHKQSVDLNSKGQFHYELSLQKPAYIEVNFGKQVSFYSHPDDSIHLEIDADKKLNSIKVSGDRQKINQYLIQEAYEAEKLIGYFNKNFKELFSIKEKQYMAGSNKY